MPSPPSFSFSRARRFGIALVLIALAITACSGQPRLDRKQLEAEIDAQLLSEYPGQISSITCPDLDDPVPGNSFVCAAILGNEVLDVQVVLGGTAEELTASASVDARFVAVNEIGALLAATFGDEIGIPTSVDCGQPVLVIPEGEAVRCAATDPSGVVRTFDVVIGEAGMLELSLR